MNHTKRDGYLTSSLLNDVRINSTEKLEISDDNIVSALSALHKAKRRRKLFNMCALFAFIISLICCCVVPLLLVGGWLGAGSKMWDIVFGINPQNCNQFRANTPANFTINYDCPELVNPPSQWKTKLAPYFVPLTKTEVVTFTSRPADWLPDFRCCLYCWNTLQTRCH